jgi:hypothetical protein
MDLTEVNKMHIDSLTHYELLEKWRFSPSGDPWFKGETGKYWGKRMADLRDAFPAQVVADSKAIGWGR